MADTNTNNVYDSKIDFYLSEFCRINNIDSLRECSQNVWNAALIYAGRKSFPDREVLKIKQGYVHGDIYTDHKMYDIGIVNNLCDYYIYLCNLYDKEVSVMGFSKLSGISYSAINSWGNSNSSSKPLTKDYKIVYQKLYCEREESLVAKLASNKNPVATIAILNKHFGYNMPGVSREQNITVLGADSLPRLRISATENPHQTDNNEQAQDVVLDAE